MLLASIRSSSTVFNDGLYVLSQTSFRTVSLGCSAKWEKTSNRICQVVTLQKFPSDFNIFQWKCSLQNENGLDLFFLRPERLGSLAGMWPKSSTILFSYVTTYQMVWTWMKWLIPWYAIVMWASLVLNPSFWQLGIEGVGAVRVS